MHGDHISLNNKYKQYIKWNTTHMVEHLQVYVLYDSHLLDADGVNFNQFYKHIDLLLVTAEQYSGKRG